MSNETPDLSPLAQNLIHREAPDAELRALLMELEETAQELRTELDARHGASQQLAAQRAADAEGAGGSDAADAADAAPAADAGAAAPAAEKPRRKVNPNVTPEQEEELKHFPEYWANSQGSWSNLFKLLRELRNEMREGKRNA